MFFILKFNRELNRPSRESLLVERSSAPPSSSPTTTNSNFCLENLDNNSSTSLEKVSLDDSDKQLTRKKTQKRKATTTLSSPSTGKF